jgi:hypothetical protein
MGRKKCKTCLGCFYYFWVDGIRYYHCTLCRETWRGRDDNLELCEDPRNPSNYVKEQEQEDDIIHNADSK